MNGQSEQNSQGDLERRYRRLLACYPRAYRHEFGEEILAVLMATAVEGQQRPELAASADLIRAAFWMHLLPGRAHPPAPVRHAVALMVIGALTSLGAVITMLVSVPTLKAAVYRRYPSLTASQWHGVRTELTVKEIGVAVTIGLWLVLAWALARGHNAARGVFAGYFCLTALSLLVALSQDAAILAPADLVAGAVIWLVQLAALLLLVTEQAKSFYHSRTGWTPSPGH
jgi:hypothetical protein